MDISDTTQNIRVGLAIWPYVQPPISQSCWFEIFDIVKRKKWVERNWTISLYICAIYILLIFSGSKYM